MHSNYRTLVQLHATPFLSRVACGCAHIAFHSHQRQAHCIVTVPLSRLNYSIPIAYLSSDGSSPKISIPSQFRALKNQSRANPELRPFILVRSRANPTQIPSKSRALPMPKLVYIQDLVCTIQWLQPKNS